jgi:hypothetical protein
VLEVVLEVLEALEGVRCVLLHILEAHPRPSWAHTAPGGGGVIGPNFSHPSMIQDAP